MENLPNHHTPIRYWAEDERPREKMQQLGASALSKSELLAILINHGTRRRSALELARDLLDSCNGSIHQLARMSLTDLQRVKGIGPAKAVTIKAALELAIRKEADRQALQRKTITGSGDAADYIRHLLQDATEEHFMVIFMNQSGRVTGSQTLSRGGINATVVDIRSLAKLALGAGATSLILAHNHPSGNLKPSEQDRQLTRKLQEGLKLLDINVLDHLIVSDEGSFSFRDEGLM